MIVMKHLILILSGMLLSISLQAQQRVVTGRVSVFKTMNLCNIRVESKKTGSTVTTDSLGFYQLVCDQKDEITFSGITFSTLKKRVKPATKEVNVNMKFLPKPENVDMAVGYGYISKENATTAYANLNRSNADFCSYNDIYELIEGKCAGVIVGKTNFLPGSDQDITIRGVNSINQSNPLYIVDGVPTSQIAQIVPCDVKSISFLKDAEAAIYGASGGGGVILIQTKMGKDN
jgi:TonB-dependent SusC/RagA subfamily outer membrane receptor